MSASRARAIYKSCNSFSRATKMKTRSALGLAGLMLTVLLILPVSACVLPSYGKVTGGGHGKIPSSPGIPGGSFGFNVRWSEGDPAPKGEIQYVDHSTGMRVHGHTMTDLWVSPDKTVAWFRGECTIDGVPGFTFYVYVEDNGEPGRNDEFIIELSNSYSAGNTLLCGNIQIHTKP